MPRRNLIKSSSHYYHVTTRSNHADWFCLPLEQVWGIAEYSIRKALAHHPAQVAQFVLMNNHYHLLIMTPNMDLEQFMYFFNKTFSELLRKQSGQINRMFGSRYKASLIQSNIYLQRVYRYIYQNPLRAKIVARCEDYPYSTLFYQRQKIGWWTKIDEIQQIDNSYLTLLNQASLPTDDCEVRKGLKKTIYKSVNSRR